tara:strand:- start:187 stop:951 length:765 start_codon:yes stop_codon:yes gene_type:complete
MANNTIASSRVLENGRQQLEAEIFLTELQELFIGPNNRTRTSMPSSPSDSDEDRVDPMRLLNIANSLLECDGAIEAVDRMNYRRERQQLQNAANAFLVPMAPQVQRISREHPRTSRIRHSGFLSTATPDIESDAIEESLTATVSMKKVLSDEGKSCLKKIKFHSKRHKQKTCPITQEAFEKKQIVTILPCTHIFNSDAIQKWVETEKAECPVCRYALPSKNISTRSSSPTLSLSETNHLTQTARLFAEEDAENQ